MSESTETTTATPATSGNGAPASRCGVTAAIKWLNFYAADLLAPISKARRTCERCGRWMLKGYLIEAPTKIAGMTDLQILCWRCARPTWLSWVRLRAARR